jgi:hypothetical protein
MARESWRDVLSRGLQAENLANSAVARSVGALVQAVNSGELEEAKATALLLRACQEAFQALKDAPQGKHIHLNVARRKAHRCLFAAHVRFADSRCEFAADVRCAGDRACEPSRAASEGGHKRAQTAGLFRGVRCPVDGATWHL